MAVDNVYAARASALGYAFQFRFALHEALLALRSGYDWSISIEAADDVEYSDAAKRELTQLKHRKPGEKITDSSSDLWKSLRIWADGLKSGEIDASRDRMFLVTTAACDADSVAGFLSAAEETRDTERAQGRLDAIASNTKNKTNLKLYESWNKLSSAEKAALLRSVTVICQGADISKVDAKIKEAVRIGNRPEYLAAFVERLEGWWFRRCIEILAEGSRDSIAAEELDGFCNDLRDQFGPNSLPVDEDLFKEIVSPDIEEHADKIYVKQAQLVGIGSRRLQTAVRDYLRAFTQRSRWSRHNLVGIGELEIYEQKLQEEWAVLFDRLVDEMPNVDIEAEKSKVARKVYAWVEDALASPIRPECVEPFVTRGSLHMLADKCMVGWHPDFVSRLSAILEPAVSV